MEIEVKFEGDFRRSLFDDGVKGYMGIWYDEEVDQPILSVGYDAPNEERQFAYVALSESEIEWMIYKLTLVHEQAQSAGKFQEEKIEEIQ